MATPLSKKLGIKSGMNVWTVHAPDQFETLLQPLPEGADLIEMDLAGVNGSCFELAILFAESELELRHGFNQLFGCMGATSTLWLSWPKKSSKKKSDLSFQIVQQLGLSVGIVDNKVCSVDEVWTAIRMVVRLENRPQWGR